MDSQGFILSRLGDKDQDGVKPAEGPVVVEATIPVSSTPFGEVQLELPVKEDVLPSSKEKREVSDKELPETKPSFGEVQVHTSPVLCTICRLARKSRKARTM